MHFIALFTHVRLDILVLQVKGVLPDVDTDDGNVGCRSAFCVMTLNRLTEERVLIRSGHNFELLGALVVSEPAPSRTLHTGSLRVHLGLEVLEGPKVGLDLLDELARRLGLGCLGAVRGEVGPEELHISYSTPTNSQLHTEWLLSRQPLATHGAIRRTCDHRR